MPRKKAAKFKCEKCGKGFGMAMHLGRHMTTIHGQAPAKPASPAKATAPTKPAKVRGPKARPIGRPPGVVGRLGLRNMSLEQLVEVISAVKDEATRRIAEIQEVIR